MKKQNKKQRIEIEYVTKREYLLSRLFNNWIFALIILLIILSSLLTYKIIMNNLYESVDNKYSIKIDNFADNHGIYTFPKGTEVNCEEGVNIVKSYFGQVSIYGCMDFKDGKCSGQDKFCIVHETKRVLRSELK